VVSEPAFGRGPGCGASAPRSLASSILGWIISKEAYPLSWKGSEDLGLQDLDEAEEATPVAACGCKARLGNDFDQRRTRRNRDRVSYRLRTAADPIAPAAVETSIFGCRWKRPQLRRPRSASSDKGQGNRACDSKTPRSRAKGGPVATRDREARRPRTKSSEIATCGRWNQRLRTKVKPTVSWK
jgi:hypothetical protein